MTTAVFVHGAWHDTWCWNLVRERLDDAGVVSVAFDLPMTTLDADAKVLSDALDALDDDAVVIGHSWGGSVVTLGAAGHDNVRRVIYLCAFMIEAGVPVTTERRETPGASAMEIEGDICVINPELASAVFYNDVDPAIAAEATARLRPFYVTGFAPVPAELPPAWKLYPTSYVVCQQDRAIHPDDQRDMARAASDVVEWPTSHSPFLSRPDLVADFVAHKVLHSD
jgi:pimeloyl-ACP methyl ester carboxylesterase